MPAPDKEEKAPRADRALVQKLRVVEGASLRFVETGHVAHDTFDLGWEATPAPAERRDPPARAPQPPPPPAAPNPFELDAERLFPVAAPSPPTPPVPSRPERAVVAPPDPSPPSAPPPPRKDPPRHAPAATRPDELETLPAAFRRLDVVILQRAMSSFDVLDVIRGETLIGEGERHPALVMPVRGMLEAVRGKTRVRAVSGEVLGLTTLFGAGVWPFTLNALTDCRLLVLELEAYQALRSEGSRVSLAIEEYALDALLESLERTAAELARELTAKPLAELVPSKGFFARFANAFGGGGISAARVDVVEALATSDLFRNAERGQLEAQRDRWGGVRVGRGEFLVTQGQPGTHLYLLVSGSVDVISAVGPNRAVRHETLRPGDLFDGWSMVRSSGGYASSVVMESSVLLEMEKPTWAELAASRGDVGSVLRLAMLRSLTRRLTNARALLADFQGGPPEQQVDGEDPNSQFVTINPASRR